MRLIISFLILFSSTILLANDDYTHAARMVIERTLGNIPFKYHFEKDVKIDQCDQIKSTVANQVLTIKGSSGVALCHGFYKFIKRNQMGIVSWSGTRFEPPKALIDQPIHSLTSPVKHHYYFNVVTYGYTMAYWDWNRWEKEIDWMALHGIDMPLALCANEAIAIRVWKKMGLSDTQIDAFYVGPAHLPWQRMGNLINHDGPLPSSWHKQQIILQHKILKRMRELKMKPICPAFAGFVPSGIKELYPNVKINQLNWGGFPKKNNASILSASDPLFIEIGKLYIQEWEKEFGTCEYYLADMFNEMEIPVPQNDKAKRYEMLAQFGKIGYQSITEANPNAVWVMQGWMLGYQRYIWDPQSLKALISKVPHDKMIILDLGTDYNKNYWKNGMNWDFYNGFFEKQWVYSVIPNMGAKTGQTGILEFYANGHLEALNSKNRGNLVGIGMAPEGIENNEIIYELLTDVAWHSNKTNLKSWLKNYAMCRYGAYPDALKKSYDYLLESVYGSFTDHPRFNWQFAPPATQGSIHTTDTYKIGLKSFYEAFDDLKDNPLYRTDLQEYTAMYLGIKMQEVSAKMVDAATNDDLETADKLFKEFKTLATHSDLLLKHHPYLNLQTWVKYARNSGKTTYEKDYYEANAKRLITIWGPPINDYAAKIWGDLIYTYYLPRWELWLKMQHGKITQDDRINFEFNWVKTPMSPDTSRLSSQKLMDLVKIAIQNADSIVTPQIKSLPIAGQWDPTMISNSWKTLSFNIPSTQVNQLKAVRFKFTRGTHRLQLRNLKIVGDGRTIIQLKQQGTAGVPSENNQFNFSIPANTIINNICKIEIEVCADSGSNSFGKVELIYLK